jgi:hypothetical protein
VFGQKNPTLRIQNHYELPLNPAADVSLLSNMTSPVFDYSQYKSNCPLRQVKPPETLIDCDNDLDVSDNNIAQ